MSSKIQQAHLRSALRSLMYATGHASTWCTVEESSWGLQAVGLCTNCRHKTTVNLKTNGVIDVVASQTCTGKKE